MARSLGLVWQSVTGGTWGGVEHRNHNSRPCTSKASIKGETNGGRVGDDSNASIAQC